MNNKYIHNEIKQFYMYGIVSFILIILMQFLSIIPPVFMKNIIDIYIPNSDLNNIYFSIIILGTIPVFSTLISVLFNYFLFINVKKLAFEIKVKIVKKSLYQPMTFFSDHTTGELLEYCSQDTTNYIYFWLMDFPNTISNIVMTIIMFIILLNLNIKVTLLQLISIPLIFLPTKYFGKKIKNYSINIVKSNAQLKQIINESFIGIKTIKIFGLHNNRINKMKDVFNNSIKFFAKVAMLDKLYGEWTQKFIVVIFTSISFGLCSIDVINNSMSIGDMVIYITYLPKIYNYITQTSLMNLKFNKQLGEYSKQFELLNLNIENDSKFDKEIFLQGKIEFKDVSFKYPNGDKYVLENFNFLIHPGEFIGITGSNGIGKSTIFNLLYKFYDEYSGDIYIDDINIKNLSQNCLVKNISLVSQEIFLFNGTLKENLLMANPNATEDDIETVLEAVNIKSWINTLPNGLNTELGENGFNLSGGQKQRISLAMGLLKQSKILLLDEVTSSLDNESEIYIKETLNNLNSNDNITIVAISHRNDLLEKATNIYSL